MHSWGDGFKYFREVGMAAQEIGDFCVKYGRIGIRASKEKYGTVRVYLSFGLWGFHSLLKPGYVYNQWPKWLWNIDCEVGTKILSPFNLLVIPYQKFIYRIAYKRAIKKYPFIRKEILGGADYRELLKGL